MRLSAIDSGRICARVRDGEGDHPSSPPQHLRRVAQFAHGTNPQREVWFTVAALAVTMAAGVFSLLDVGAVLAARVLAGAWAPAAAQTLFLVIVASLVYGACVYLFARLGYIRRIVEHAPAHDEVLAVVFGESDPPLITILVPSYMEEPRIVRRTLLSAALQTYPRRRVVLLIDDPPRTGDAA
jgi:hypothetical protein